MFWSLYLFTGNGILHPRGLGLASHFGIVADICTIGVAKNLHQMGSIVRDETHLTQIYALKEPGDMVPLEGGCGVVWPAYKCCVLTLKNNLCFIHFYKGSEDK